MVFRNHEQVACFRADFFDCGHGSLHGQRQHLRRQVVPAGRKQIGVDRREFEAGVADIDRAVKRRRMFHPLQPEPAFYGRSALQHALLEFIDGASQGGDEVRNHAAFFWEWVVVSHSPKHWLNRPHAENAAHAYGRA